MALGPVTVEGDTSTHTGVLIATGVKLLVSGLPVGVVGDLSMVHPIPTTHPFGVIAPIPHKLMVSGFYVGVNGDIMICPGSAVPATIIGTGIKLETI